MKNINLLCLLIIVALVFYSCKKKLPERPSEYDSYYTEFNSLELEDFDPCVDNLVEGSAEFLDTIPEGNIFSVSQRAFGINGADISSGFDDLEIKADDYSSTNAFKLVYKNTSLLELKRSFGKRTFTYSEEGNSKGAPLFCFTANTIGNGYSKCLDGTLYVEYLDSSAVYSFCKVSFNHGRIGSGKQSIIEIIGKFEVDLFE